MSDDTSPDPEPGAIPPPQPPREGGPQETPPAEGGTSFTGPDESHNPGRGWAKAPLAALFVVVLLVALFFAFYGLELSRS
ncbi:DUF6480 family protein [Streptomyces sp. NPDC005438]|uniref:DUF6480 family protein n=1 Tax=Streptomyces sp. NPDC005438 TaxID=3156880 RepID=UPI0033BF3C4A